MPAARPPARSRGTPGAAAPPLTLATELTCVMRYRRHHFTAVGVASPKIAEEFLVEHNPMARMTMYGQELNEQTYAIAKSDVLIMGENAENIRDKSSFSRDQFKGQRFSYMLSNPPFGVSWVKEENFIKNEADDPHGRFTAGMGTHYRPSMITGERSSTPSLTEPAKAANRRVETR